MNNHKIENNFKNRRHKRKIIQKLNEHMHNKYMNDPIFKIKVLLRNRINKALIRGMKPNSAVKLLGCTIDELKVHLEDKFYNNSETNEK